MRRNPVDGRLERATLPDIISTERLQLRPWSLADVDEVFAYARDPTWSRFLHLVPVPYGRRDAEIFIARQLLLDRVTHRSWAITLDEAVIGGINIRFVFDHRLGELGYSVARAHWNRGICSEAGRALMGAAFERHPDLNRIRAYADARNTASQRVMEKLGMVREGVLRANRLERGEMMDEAWYGILRSEWESFPARPRTSERSPSA